MKKSRVLMSASTLAAAGVVSAGLSGFAALDAAQVNAVAAVAAIQQVAPAAVSAVVATSSDADSAAQVVLPSGDAVSMPTDPTQGVQLTGAAGAPDLTIGLPFAEQAKNAVQSPKKGVVVYDNGNGSSTVPVVHADGSVQITTVIADAGAPKRYEYPIDVAAGASLFRSPDGVVAVIAADGSPLRVFGDAWAKDANGEAVPTHYELRGDTLTQVVDFTEHTAFPVIADPTTTGVYSYNCVNSNGSSYFMKPGEKLMNCKGSFIQRYINGAMVQSIKLAYGGGAAGDPPRNLAGCIISVGGGVVMIFFPPTSGWGWFWTTAATGAGIVSSCVA